ncbi:MULTISPECIES: glutamate-5-semialdehyde dehydrogenase [Idiomarinaceae]|uniref:Gamma-glutamyl phosphate reductase n=1 Tax=Pseudidiomarina fusca TaxID=2965078 RepID=A0ABU3KXV0_9GAMM|nr:MULTISPECIES: glutamate-5-semialdehyde dehydrogenase [Idiomarinaceae]MDT7526286.1 glutamate-5-semialdehyde dehydrogenase [Pseudidiomarina sp. GXY010]MRJ43041.1 glutamate-5-semialdehyde dehydrogenase [Idiomarina sp. FeN1]NCU58223.1 glutamate-5-semialdehyde dehydrogenase [Idiomarina sp. FenA--70]NCU60921.1 glutamate-5-semialdehyde dehydrogenase [Idiomarina sp. FenBw--71]UUN13994.1 glutamate-5-semialdehyde dehydrogenase [Idiomarina loihiensis]
MSTPLAEQISQRAAVAARAIATLSEADKNTVLQRMADAIRANQATILEVNERDMSAGRDKGLSDAMLDRLQLDPERLEGIAAAIEEIIALPDPVGERLPFTTRPNGMVVEKMRIPLGVICMIYEARPNVTADAGALCFKSGNAVILRCGREAIETSKAIAAALHQALRESNLPEDVITVVPTPDRDLLLELLQQDQNIDLVIPRGGEGLIHFVSDNSKIPVIQHYKGVCHLYVDKDADLDKALALLLNGKTQRTGVCNALEGLLVHQAVAAKFLPMAAAALAEKQVVIHSDQASANYFADADVIADDAFGQEYLALELAVRTVPDFAAAIEHIQQFGSGHTEVIVTENQDTAEQFIRTVDSAVTMHNTSSRFSDGGQLGLGAEIGISTSKLHAYGPMGLQSLTTEKFVVTGTGQIRE